MVDLATLGLKVESSGVKQGAADLGVLSASAQKAEAATDSLAASTREASTSARGMAAAASAEAGALDAVVPAANRSEAAHKRLKVQQEVTSYQTRNLRFQMIDLAQGIPMWFQSPLYALINVGNQGAQIAQIYGPEEGGVGRAFREAAGMAARFAARLAPVAAIAAVGAVGVEALATKIERATGKTVSFGNVLQAMWELLRDKVTSVLSGIGDWLEPIWKKIENFSRDAYNFVVKQFAYLGSELQMYAEMIEALWTRAGDGIAIRWKMLPAAIGDVMITLANNSISAVTSLVNGVIGAINGMIGTVNDKLGLSIGTLGEVSGPQISNPHAGAYDAYSKAITANGKLADADVAKAMKAREARDAAIDKSDPFATLSAKASEIAGRPDEKQQKELDRQAKAYEQLTLNAQQYIEAQELEARTLGMTEEAASRLRHEQELLNRAADQHIKMTPERTSALEKLAAGMARAEAAAKKLKEAYDFSKSTFKSFFEDLRTGIANGDGFWKSFEKAGLNALDRISQKLMDMATDKAFDALFGGLFTGGSTSTVGKLFSFLGLANGGVLNQGALVPFAAGGIVSRPTIFPMARGMGLMGEAGPEAIMPLRRTPDGRLGVAASGTGAAQSSPAVIRLELDEPMLKAKIRTEAAPVAVEVVKGASKAQQRRQLTGGN